MTRHPLVGTTRTRGVLTGYFYPGPVVAGRAEGAQMTDTTDATVQPHFGELLDGLRATFATGVTRPLAWRARQLDALQRFLAERESELVEAIQHDLGRPVAEAFGADIGHSRVHIKHTRKHFERWARPQRGSVGALSFPATAQVISEPLGVALVISPWNYPVQLLVEPLAAALAAGNCVVVKPSELAPSTSAVIARHLPNYLDPEAVVVVEGAVEETTALLEQRFDHIFFTGSTGVGKVVMAAAARHLTPVTLELGGKSPTIVAADADIGVAARRIVWGKLINAGQTCIAPDYLLVEDAVVDELIDRIRSTIRSFYGDDPAGSADLGRIVNERHFDRVCGLVDGGGGTVVIGGGRDRTTRKIEPTVVLDPDLDSPLMAEEIFGPVLPVVRVASIDQAIDAVNSRPKPLALYVFTSSNATADRVIASTSSGGACVNHVVVHVLPESLPFGGVGPSGMGAYHGRAGFDAFSHRRTVLRKPTRPDPAMLYPPYTKAKESLIRRVLR